MVNRLVGKIVKVIVEEAELKEDFEQAQKQGVGCFDCLLCLPCLLA
jgi:c-di-GMP-related signal transduction protein